MSRDIKYIGMDVHQEAICNFVNNRKSLLQKESFGRGRVLTCLALRKAMTVGSECNRRKENPAQTEA